ncbi:glycosyltransferase family 39 protein [Tropicimonas sp. TH_r6]|uniref:ArnT family glycosyltransferase n=1 Tax=Tropicimonas sp. TH_r6 TaxID=3082085 RepID=UPI002952E766|nr:glycosyltransferase family 39 protein [Tropicimonas sp. TH_r6]MDV7143294.1 glycosyltransferase family 39 protein [Tropicimonas sp. TH_r6]
MSIAQHAGNSVENGAVAWRWLPWTITALSIALVWSAQVQLLPVGGYHFYDEFHTLDRSSAFATHDDWLVVHSMQEESFRKPPLQYWITAGLLETGLDELVALRLPSLVFSLGCLLAVALLAVAVMPWNVWAAPGAVLLFASSGMYWEHALSAMLDSGAVFFSTLALAATLLALERPRWWYVAAVAIALGALQKAPVGLILVGLFLAFLPLDRRTDRLHVRQIRANRHFRRALWIALLGTLAWPLFESLAYSADAVQELIGKQMLQRFTPTDKVNEIRSAHDLRELLIGQEPILRLAGIAALIWLPWRLDRPELRPLPALLGLYALALLLAGGHVTPRYSLFFLPLLAVALSCLIVSFAPRGWPGLAAVAVFALAVGGPVKTEADLDIATSENNRQQTVALTRLGTQLRPRESLVLCLFGGPDRIIPALASHLAANGRPFHRLNGDLRSVQNDLADAASAGPIRGLCNARDLERISPYLDELEIVTILPGYLIWTARSDR